MKNDQQGFTIIEVVVSLLLLTIGAVALAGSSAMVTRMIGRGKTTTFVAQVAEWRLERLRSIAMSTTPPCTSSAFASSTAPAATQGGVIESWTVTTATPTSRTVTVTVTYQTPKGPKSATVSTLISCFKS